MASASLARPQPLHNPQCDSRDGGARCPAPATWTVRTEEKGMDAVAFVCSPHALQRIGHAIAYGKAVHAVPIRERQ